MSQNTDIHVIIVHNGGPRAGLSAAVAAATPHAGGVTIVDLSGALGEAAVGAPVFTAPGGALGPALRALIPSLPALVAIRSDEAAFDPRGLALAQAAITDEIDVVMSRFAVTGANGRVAWVIDPAQDGDKPPQCAEDGVVVRTAALAESPLLAFHPTLFVLLRDAVRAGRAAVLPEALFRVSADRFALGRLSRAADLHLLHAHNVDYDLGQPWLSVVVPADGSRGLGAALNSLCRQTLPIGLYEIIVPDAGGNEWLDGVSTAVPLRRLPMPSASAGALLQAGLEAAVGVLLWTFAPDALALPDSAERHIRAHRERPDQRIFVVGSREAPASEDESALTLALEGLEPAASYNDLEAIPLRPAQSLELYNTSFTPEAALLVGGFGVDLEALVGQDLGWRVAEFGYEALALPEARSIRQGALSIDAHVAATEARARDGVLVMARNPAALDAAGLHELRAAELEGLLERQGASAALVRRAVLGLGAVETAALQPFGEDWAAFGEDAGRRVSQLLRHLDRLAEARGRLAGLRALEVDGFPALLRRQPLTLPGRCGTLFVARPLAGEEMGWLHPLAHYLFHFGPNDDTTLLLLADPDAGGLSAETLRAGVMELTSRLRAGPRGGWADVQVAERTSRPGELLRLLASADGYILGANEPDPALEGAAAAVGTPLEQPEGWATRFTGGVTPLPLDTEATYRLLVWPDWQAAGAVEHMFEQYGRAIANREDTVLVVRFDVDQDGDPDEAAAALGAAWESTMGDGWALQVLLVDQPVDAEAVAQLAAATSAVALGPTGDGPRDAALRALGRPVHEDGVAVTIHLFEQPPAPFGPLYPPTLQLR
ncbi:MAG: glycosyltransferase family 2 protein [Deltaproteobacteria bacterium]|nr:glycosyltransferase family 2 protein [Deltaproteobacteria bacterium]